MKKNKVLIIDDEADILETMTFRLSSAGYEVLTTQDGSVGFEKAKEFCPGLIILDVMMPGIDGFETLRKLKEDPSTREIPVVIFSCGAEEEEWAKKSLKLGASGYIVKPFEVEALLFTVQNFMKRKTSKT